MTRIALLLGLAAATAACGSKSSGNNSNSIHGDAFDALTKSIHKGDAWSPAAASVDKLLGAAKAKDDHSWRWTVAEESDCWEIELGKAGDAVGYVNFEHVDKTFDKPFAKCVARAK